MHLTPDFASPDSPIDLSPDGPFAGCINQKRYKEAARLSKLLVCHDVPGRPSFHDAAPRWLFDAVLFLVSVQHMHKAGLATHVNRCLLSCAKKQSKSTGVAALAILHTMMAIRPSGRVLLLAAELSGVAVVYSAVSGMIRSSHDEIRTAYKITDHERQITHIPSQTIMKTAPFSPAAVTGSLAGLVIVDEVSLAGHVRDNRSTLEEATGAASIPERLFVGLSTMDAGISRGIWADLLTEAREVKAGTRQSPRMLPILFEPPESTRKLAMKLDDLLSRPELLLEAMEASNPSLGITTQRDDLSAGMQRALANGPEAMQVWMAKFLNLEILAPVGSSMRPLPFAEFVTPNMTAECEDWRAFKEGAEKVVMAIDGGGYDDLMALSVAARYPDGKIRTWTHHWCNPSAMRRRELAELLQGFELRGELTVMQHDELLEPVQRLAAEIAGHFVDPVLVIDNGSKATLTDPAFLDPIGIPDNMIHRGPRGVATTAGATIATRLAAGGLVQFRPSTCMTWQCGNVQISARDLIEKVSPHAKIDGIVAVIMAIWGLHVTQDAPVLYFTL